MNRLEAAQYDGGKHELTLVWWLTDHYYATTMPAGLDVLDAFEKAMAEESELELYPYGNVMMVNYAHPETTRFIHDLLTWGRVANS